MGIEDVCNFGRGGREGIFVHACATCHTLPSSQKKNVAVVRLHVTPLAPRATHSKFRRVSIIGKRSSSYLPSSSSASWDAEEEEEGQRRSLAARVNTGEREREKGTLFLSHQNRRERRILLRGKDEPLLLLLSPRRNIFPLTRQVCT